MGRDFKFKEALASLQSDLVRMVRQKDELEKQIGAAKQSIAGLLQLRDATFAGEDEDEGEPSDPVNALAQAMDEFNAAKILSTAPASLTEACRATVRASDHPMMAGEIRREVEMKGFDFSRYSSNPLSAIHTILSQRLSEEIQRSKNTEGKTVYEWKRVLPPRAKRNYYGEKGKM